MRKLLRRWHHPQLWIIAFVLCLCAAAVRMEQHEPLLANHPPASATPESLKVLQTPPTRPLDCAQVACVALTFDDGPDAALTPQVLAILDQADVRATFFVLGSRIAGRESIVREMYVQGHEIGNHSWGHIKLTTLPPERIRQEVEDTQIAVMKTGVPAPRLFRPPYGAVDPVVRANVPLTLAMWNVDPEDWRAPDSGAIIQHVMMHAKPGAIIDLHDTNPATLEALPTVVQNLKQHYQLVTVSELLSLPPGQPGAYYGR